MKKLKLALLLTSLLAVVPAMAQDDLSTPDAIALRNQILQLQSQVNALQANQNGGQNNGQSSLAAPLPQGGAPVASTSNDLLPDLVTRVSNLENQVRTLTGEVDELTNQLKVQNQTFTKQIGDINFQLQGGAGAAPAANAPAGSTPGTSAAPGSPTAITPDPNAVPGATSTDIPPEASATDLSGAAAAGGTSANLPTGTLGTLPADQVPAAPPPAVPTSQDTLEHGINALGKHDYTVAATDAKAVLATDRASLVGYDAQFLLARAYAGKRDWQNAVLAYDDTYRRAPVGSHSQDAQVGEARSLLALGDNGAACTALARLTKRYPNPRADLRPAIASLHSRACGA